MHQLVMWFVNDLEGRCFIYQSSVCREGLRKTTKTVESLVFLLKFELSTSRLQVEIVATCASSLGAAVLLASGNLLYRVQISRVYGAYLEPFEQQSS